jgi:hypothetical protein
VHISGVGGSDGEGWRVASIAIDDGPWGVGVDLGGGYVLITPEALRDNGRTRPTEAETVAAALDNAARFSNAITTAITRAGGAALKETCS